MNVLDTILQAGSGGVIGALASIGTGVVSIFQSKAQFAHDEMMAEANLKLTQIQGELAQKVEEAKFKTLLESDDATAFTASQTGANSASGWPFADGIVKLWRPTLTGILMALTAYFYATNSDQQMRDYITKAITELTGLAVAWWFGSRQISQSFAAKPKS